MRGLCLGALLLIPFAVRAAPGSPNALPSIGKDEAAQVLSDFRNSGLARDIILKFELRHLPRSGETGPAQPGTLWMSWRHGQPAARIEIGGNRFLLLRKDGKSELWKSTDSTAAVAVSASDALKPLLPGHLFAPFDLQAPFTHWVETSYERTERRRGRPLNLFIAKATAGSQPTAVRFGLDRAYLALIEATSLDASGKPLRLMLAEDFAQVDGTWILGKASVRDEQTRDRDTLDAKSACVDARLPASLFTPASLTVPAPDAGGTFHSL